MTLFNFLNAGGVIEVRLQRDLIGLGLKPEELFAGANSIETAKELVDKMNAVEMFVRPIFFKQMQDVKIEMFVECICLTWNMTQYSFNGGWRMLRHAIIIHKLFFILYVIEYKHSVFNEFILQCKR